MISPMFGKMWWMLNQALINGYTEIRSPGEQKHDKISHCSDMSTDFIITVMMD